MDFNGYELFHRHFSSVVTHADYLHLFMFSVLPHDISKTDAARITKLDMEMFHDES